MKSRPPCVARPQMKILANRQSTRCSAPRRDSAPEISALRSEKVIETPTMKSKLAASAQGARVGGVRKRGGAHSASVLAVAHASRSRPGQRRPTDCGRSRGTRPLHCPRRSSRPRSARGTRRATATVGSCAAPQGAARMTARPVRRGANHTSWPDIVLRRRCGCRARAAAARRTALTVGFFLGSSHSSQNRLCDGIHGAVICRR